MQTESLLIEIGTEELPPERLNKLGQTWLNLFIEALDKQDMPHEGGTFYIAPRRMALLIKGLPENQASRNIQRRGPSVAAAFDADGNPTKAVLGFAQSNSTSVDKLERLETDKGAWLVYNSVEQGKTIGELVPEILKSSLAKLPIGRKMRWGDLDEEFIRPVHWIVALHGTKIIPIKLFGIESSNQTRGHRFHAPDAMSIPSADAYLEIMHECFVLADYEERAQSIKSQSEALAQSVNATVKIDDNLLDLVTGLNEWPKPMLATFDEAFLDVPQEALITAMQYHQKSFPLLDANGKLINKFILVANTDAKPPTQIIHGNERVMHARLSDAKFFYTQDCKTSLESHLDGLKKMVFQKKLGTLFDKTQRIKKLSKAIATRIDAPVHHAERAAILSKCDLLTEMVGEFPELQGIMGYYYALYANEVAEVANGIKEAYLPRFAKDELPDSQTGLCTSLADKLDTLVGIFGIGKAPTGDKDPFALRRAALGILRIITEKQLDLDLKSLIEESVASYRTVVSEEVIPEILSFCFERFRAMYQDKGISPKVLDAVMATHGPTKPLDFAKRVEAVSHFQTLPQAEALAAANKRVRNILTKSGFKIDFAQNPNVESNRLTEPEEIALFEQMQKLKEATKPFVEKGEYTQTLTELAQLKDPVDMFFDKVMVNVDDDGVRQNRVNLLSNLHNLFGQVADISRL